MPTDDENNSERPPPRFCDQCGSAIRDHAGDATGHPVGDPLLDGLRPSRQSFIPIGEDDETPTPPPRAPYSGTALNLLDVALATQSLVESLRETARQYDGVQGVARQHLAAEAGRRLTSLGGILVEAGEALKDESGR